MNRSPWMSDAGYASGQRAEKLDPPLPAWMKPLSADEAMRLPWRSQLRLVAFGALAAAFVVLMLCAMGLVTAEVAGLQGIVDELWGIQAAEYRAAGSAWDAGMVLFLRGFASAVSLAMCAAILVMAVFAGGAVWRFLLVLGSTSESFFKRNPK